MLDPITMLILRIVASTCIKFYVASLLGAGQVTYDADELGYQIPKWYMNPGRSSKVFYSYGTSVNGDEFESIEDARQQAVNQMAQHIRLSNRAIIEKEVHYDSSSVKQRRLVELFVRGDGLEELIRIHAKMDKKELVRVTMPQSDMRAFVRMQLQVKTYLKYQEASLGDLKTRLMQQKTDDILAEMQAEKEAWEAEAATLHGGLPAGFKPGDIAAPAPIEIPDMPMPRPDEPAAAAARPTPPHAPTPPATGGGPWEDMEQELDDLR